VLLLDRPAGQLVATAASGIEEEVTQGVRVPLAAGFAGTVAVSARPVILNRVDDSTVRNRLLIDRGLKSLLGVPLLAGGQVIGVLHVGSLSGRPFGAEDVELLQLTAPGDVLRLLDRKIQYFEPDAMATAQYAVCQPDTGQVTISSAGHLPPVLAVPGEVPHPVAFDVDPPLGVCDDMPRRSTVLDIPPGACYAVIPTGWWSGEGSTSPMDDVAVLMLYRQPGISTGAE
jgi:hypothetical protein